MSGKAQLETEVETLTANSTIAATDQTTRARRGSYQKKFLRKGYLTPPPPPLV
jgi:hypothetical protein